MEPKAAPAPAPPVSKARKILRRTLSGARLAGTIALLLWITSHSPGGEPVFVAVTLILLAAVFELSRMGRCAELGLRYVLAAPALVLCALHASVLLAQWQERADVLLPEALTGVYGENYALELALVACTTIVAFALLHGNWWRPRVLGPGVLVLLAGLFVFRFAGAPLEATATLHFALLVCGALALCVLPAVLLQGRGRALAATLGLALWLVPPLPMLWHVWRGFGGAGLVALLVLSKIGDTAGYYVGGAIGKRHPFPKISPGKTVAGCVASFVAATAIGGAFVALDVLPAGRFGIAGGLLCGALLNVAAQAGDLFESWIKRRAGAKDSSTWFGPSGGLLDQLDSVLFSIPVAILVWPFLFPSA